MKQLKENSGLEVPKERQNVEDKIVDQKKSKIMFLKCYC